MPLKCRTQGNRARASTVARQKRFLREYEKFPTVKSAASRSKINRRTHQRWLKADPKYAAAYTELKDDMVEELEAEVYRRAVLGVERPITVAGERVMVREYSDRLLMFLLKAEKPEKYRDRREVKHGGDVNEWAEIIKLSRVLDGQEDVSRTVSS